MTRFVYTKFVGNEYVYFDGKFVARFKRGGRADFLKFLVKNFTVEEYFAKMEAGVPPLGILKQRGYVSPMTKKVLMYAGYPQTAEGEAQYLAAQLKKHYPKPNNSPLEFA